MCECVSERARESGGGGRGGKGRRERICVYRPNILVHVHVHTMYSV